MSEPNKSQKFSPSKVSSFSHKIKNVSNMSFVCVYATMVNKNTLGVKKLRGQEKQAATTKRTDIGMWPRFLQLQ